MPPTPLQILKTKVTAFKEGLAEKKPAEKKGSITYAFAEHLNQLIQETKKVEPKTSDHLPTIRFWTDEFGIGHFQQFDYIHAEIMLNQIIGIIELFDQKD